MLSEDLYNLLKDHLGAQKLSRAEHVLEKYSKDTNEYRTEPALIVFPESVSEIQYMLEFARKHSLILYPISTGKNWGYGSAAASRSNSLILDLSRMNKILEVNERDAYCVVEPGVTQEQLYLYLEEKHPNFMMDVTGSTKSASIIGNMLERGFGATLLADRVQNSFGFEVVLADGQVINTGLARYENSEVRYAFPHALGPLLSGLFTQSNLGIVTKAAIAIVPKPEKFGIFLFQVDSESKLFPIIESYNKHALTGVSVSSLKLGNHWRSLSLACQFPWKDAVNQDGKFTLPPEVVSKLLKEHGLTKWGGMLAVYSTKTAFASQMRMLREILKGCDRVVFVTPLRLKLLNFVSNNLSRILPSYIKDNIKIIQSTAQMLLGKPSDDFLKGVYWRSRSLSPEEDFDPIRDNVGFYWFSPVLPTNEKHIARHLSIVNEIFSKYGFEPQITLNQFGPRFALSIISLCFDNESPEESKRAAECYQALQDKHIESGYYPYRTGLQSMHKYINPSDKSYFDLLLTIKKSMDPQSIIAPGRYIPHID